MRLSPFAARRLQYRSLVERSRLHLDNVRREVKMWADEGVTVKLAMALPEIGPNGVAVLVAQDDRRAGIAMLGYREPERGVRGEFFGAGGVRVCAANETALAAAYVIEQVRISIAKGVPGECSGGHHPQARGVLLGLEVKDTFPLPGGDVV